MAQRTNNTIPIRVRKDEKSNRLRRIVRSIFVCACAITFFVCVWYGTRLSFFTIDDITIHGGETVSHDEILSMVKQELRGAYFLLIPKQFSYLYPRERIIERLGHNQRIFNVEVDRTDRNSLSVSFDEYLPFALWCTDTEVVTCFFITKQGYAFTEAPPLAGGALLRHIDEGVEELHVGDVIPEIKLAQLTEFVESLADANGFRVASVFHKMNGDLDFVLHGGGSINVSGDESLVETFEKLNVILTSKEFSHLKPGNFNYIDVRFSNKVFVNETITDMATSTNEVPSVLPE